MKAGVSKRRPVRVKRGFSAGVLALLRASRMLGIRAGEDHRFTGIWFVMVGDRVFVRPYYDEATGWYRPRPHRPRLQVIRRRRRRLRQQVRHRSVQEMGPRVPSNPPPQDNDRTPTSLKIVSSLGRGARSLREVTEAPPCPSRPVRSVRSLGEVTEPRSLALREAEESQRTDADVCVTGPRTAGDGGSSFAFRLSPVAPRCPRSTA